MNGKFIAFEGIDGCGKTTQLMLTARYILEKSKDSDIYIGRNPTRNFKEIRERLANIKNVKEDANWFLQAFIEDRKTHIERIIKPNLKNGTHVILDRYDFSTYAYQQAQGISFEKIKELHEGILIPDLTVIYYCDPQIAIKRRLRAGFSSLFDRSLEFLSLVQSFYINLPRLFPERNIAMIDTEKGDHKEEAIKLVFAETKRHIDKLFKLVR